MATRLGGRNGMEVQRVGWGMIKIDGTLLQSRLFSVVKLAAVEVSDGVGVQVGAEEGCKTVTRREQGLRKGEKSTHCSWTVGGQK